MKMPDVLRLWRRKQAAHSCSLLVCGMIFGICGYMLLSGIIMLLVHICVMVGIIAKGVSLMGQFATELMVFVAIVLVSFVYSVFFPGAHV